MHLGLVAIAVGALVGYAVRVGGHGTTMIYGIIGAVYTLVACVVGEALAIICQGTSADISFWTVASQVNYSDLFSTIVSHTSAISAFIYAIGIYEGYKFAIRK